MAIVRHVGIEIISTIVDATTFNRTIPTTGRALRTIGAASLLPLFVFIFIVICFSSAIQGIQKGYL